MPYFSNITATTKTIDRLTMLKLNISTRLDNKTLEQWSKCTINIT